MSYNDNKQTVMDRNVKRRQVLLGGLAAAGGVAATATGIGAPMVARADQTFSWRMQTHYPAGSPAGHAFERFIKNVEVMSGGRLKIQGFTSSSVVNIQETLSSARDGIIDADMSWAGYAAGIDPAFQWFGDVNGGYTQPEHVQYWLDYGGGRELADEIYHAHDMHLVGFWGTLPESLVSTVPVPDPASLKGIKLRCPPGLQSDVMAAWDMEPVVMDFGEVFTALDTGIVTAADATELRVNQSIGLYEVAKHATYPGWHAMPFVQLAVNRRRWEELPADLKRIVELALRRAAHERVVEDRTLDEIAVADLAASEGVTFYVWSQEDIIKLRDLARPAWEAWADRSSASRKVYDSHMAFMKKLGLIA
ncbi:TRAP transporter substrate-binding protein DctP [Halomonas alkalisoli]|uniref:TRAP transporter substrate-binding protein DctP n=1 Tax=Halomonas alkalisoli TaxID=2907158 RepID=UPI001F1FEC8C|nr:TRAP transporter substrate-binding protein DctP [Halomonas alkalisoli]MCE9683459.1 TRAP transporter substrate-binding protein DctP [Halomonas alkalisoli]